ncbi:hypothetical protein PCANC_28653 [Puccinia coronata f. sp. avenae]|uniref:Uncharacterized protein n=1 Tax=Puccinia coronata f. sp. avenae TaxID=200324 RepID=A0A2N5TH25_9BASI|nr:hypothetical protein PCANC_28653 [Puccinia coronata f. sp. avenae]
MTTQGTQKSAPTRAELEAAAGLLKQKRQAAASYQEKRRSNVEAQAGGTTGLGTTNPQNSKEQVPLTEILGAMGETREHGKRIAQPTIIELADSQEPQANKDNKQRKPKNQAKETEENHLFLIGKARRAREGGNNGLANALIRSLAKLYPKPVADTSRARANKSTKDAGSLTLD